MSPEKSSLLKFIQENFDKDFDDLDRQQSLANMSEKKRAKNLNIPSFTINQKSTQLFEQTSHQTLFLAFLKSNLQPFSADPKFIGECLDNEIR